MKTTTQRPFLQLQKVDPWARDVNSGQGWIHEVDLSEGMRGCGLGGGIRICSRRIVRGLVIGGNGDEQRPGLEDGRRRDRICCRELEVCGCGRNMFSAL